MKKILKKRFLTCRECCRNSISENKKRWYAVKLLERDSKVKENKKFPHAVLNQAETEAKELEKVHDDDMESIITDGRYNYIQKLVASTVKKAKRTALLSLTRSTGIDDKPYSRYSDFPYSYGGCVLHFRYDIGTIVTDWRMTFCSGNSGCGFIRAWRDRRRGSCDRACCRRHYRRCRRGTRICTADGNSLPVPVSP